MPTFAAAIAPRFVRERRSSAVPSAVEAGVIAILKQFEKLYTHMPLFTPYFSLDSSAYRVGNGGRLRCHMGAAGIGIYVMLLSHLLDCRDYRAPLDYDLLAFDLHEDADAVRRVVEEFDLFDIDRASGTFTSSALDAVRALGTSDSPSSGRTSTRTGRVRRVRTAAQAYRRSVRRLAADNALPPDAEENIDEPADDPLSETDSTPTEEEETPPADCATVEPAVPTLAETDVAPAKEEKTPPADAPRSAAEPAPAANENAPSPRTEEKRGEQKKIPHTPIVPFPPSGKGTRASHSSAPVVEEEEGASEAEVEGTVPAVADPPFIPAEDEETPPADASRSAAESAPAASENAPAPRTEEKRGEQNKIPHTPIVPFPPSGKGTRASHSSAPVVEEEEGASVAEVEGAVPTVADTPFVPAEEEEETPPADSPTAEIESAPADTRTPHGEGDTTQATTSADAPDTRTPRGETDTTQVTTSAIHPDTRTPHGKANTTQVTTSAAPADARTPHGEIDTTQATTSADAPDTCTSRGKTDTTQATLNTETANPAPLDTEAADDARGADAEDGGTFVPPTANEVRRFAQSLHHPEFDAEWFVHYYTARHWQRHNGHPVRSWQTTARYWLTHPLQVAQHLLRHRPDPGTAPTGTSPSPAGTSVQLPGVSPSSTGTSPSPAGVVPTTGSASLSSRGIGAAPAGTRPSSPASGVPLGGSLSLPAPTPLQQSRLCDLRHMVHHLFADAPGAAPAAAPTVPDAPAAVSTPVPSVPTSAPSPRVLSPAEAAHFIEAQTLSADPAEEENRAHELSTADNEESEPNCDELAGDAEEGIEAQALATAPAEKENRACELSTADAEEGEPNCDELASDAEEGIKAQALSTDPAEEEKRAHELSTADDEEGEPNCDELSSDAKESIEAQALAADPAEEENRACELSTTDDGEDDGNCDELATDAKEGIEKQAFPSDPAEEENRAHELSTADAEEGNGNCDELASDAKESIEAQEFPTARSEEDARTCEIDNPDGGKNMDAQAISTTKGRFSTRSSHGPAPPTGDEAAATAARHRPPSHATEKHPFTLNLNHDAPPILPLHPPAPVGLGSTLRVQSAQPPFGRALLGRIDLGHAPCPAGSRPLRPQPAEDRRGHPDHVPFDGVHEPEHPADGHPNRGFAAKRHLDAPLGGAQEPKTADFIDKSVDNEHPSRSAEPEHPIDGHSNRDFAAKHHLDASLGSAHEPKTADFIDKSVDNEHPSRFDAGEYSADGHSHRSADGKHHSDEPQRRSDTGKHRSDAPEHPADQHNAPTDEHPSRPAAGEHPADAFDAGQRLLDTAAHRRAVRAELAACCGALRHLAHCCVAF